MTERRAFTGRSPAMLQYCTARPVTERRATSRSLAMPPRLHTPYATAPPPGAQPGALQYDSPARTTITMSRYRRTVRSAPTPASHAGAPPPPAVAYRCRVSAQFASVPACTGTRRFGLRSTGRKSRRGAAPRPGAVHRSAGLSRGHLRAQQPRQSPGMLCLPGARGSGLPFAKTGIATLKIA